MKLPELETLYTLYRADLYRYLCHLTHDATEAEDLLSETFLRALRRLPTFRGDCAVKTWLFGIARHIWLENLRKRRDTVSLDDSEAMLERCLGRDTLADTTDARRALARVRELLGEMNPKTRQVVELRAQGYSYAEIAPRLQITENSARVLEHRARAVLQQTLQKEGY